MKRLLPLLLLAASGCASVTIQDSTGFMIKRMSYPFSSSRLNGFTLVVDTNGVRTLKVSGYGYDSQDNVSAMASAVAQGVVAGMRTTSP